MITEAHELPLVVGGAAITDLQADIGTCLDGRRERIVLR
jgi:hypothetical protein